MENQNLHIDRDREWRQTNGKSDNDIQLRRKPDLRESDPERPEVPIEDDEH